MGNQAPLVGDDADLTRELHAWLAGDRVGGGAISASENNALASVAGRGRAHNQDRALLARLPDGAACALLADGMGGMVAGADCASWAVAATVAYLTRGGLLEDAVRAANRAVYGHHGGSGGTTLSVVLALPDGEIRLAHAGDSRVYALSETASAHRNTQDHTALAELGERGSILPASRRAALGARLTRALGLEADIAPDMGPVSGENSLLTSDGIHDFAGAAIDTLRWGKYAPADALARLLQVALEAGSRDDRSAIWFEPAALPAAIHGRLTLWEPGAGCRQLAV